MVCLFLIMLSEDSSYNKISGISGKDEFFIKVWEDEDRGGSQIYY